MSISARFIFGLAYDSTAENEKPGTDAKSLWLTKATAMIVNKARSRLRGPSLALGKHEYSREDTKRGVFMYSSWHIVPEQFKAQSSWTVHAQFKKQSSWIVWVIIKYEMVLFMKLQHSRKCHELNTIEVYMNTSWILQMNSSWILDAV